MADPTKPCVIFVRVDCATRDALNAKARGLGLSGAELARRIVLTALDQGDDPCPTSPQASATQP